MSLKCSIFGHRFGDPVVERDRDESGSEVVITIQEIQTCDRCGEERVVSENKEVTTLEAPDDEGTESPSPEVPDAADELAAVESPSTDDGATDDGATDDEATDDAATDPGTGSAPAGGAEAMDPETDDATIIEDSPEESIVEEAEPDTPTPEAPEPATGTETDDAPADDDDAVILEEEAEDDADDDERDPGAWPEEPEDDSPEWEPPTDVGGESSEPAESALEEASPDVEPAGEAVTVPQGTFHCPECGFSTDVESSSLREGDFCPDCHTGTLVHEPDSE